MSKNSERDQEQKLIKQLAELPLGHNVRFSTIPPQIHWEEGYREKNIRDLLQVDLTLGHLNSETKKILVAICEIGLIYERRAFHQIDVNILSAEQKRIMKRVIQLFIDKKLKDLTKFGSATLWSRIGLVASSLRWIDDAILFHQIALSQDPTDGDTWYNLGVLLQDQQQYEEAEKAYRRSLKLDPTNGSTWYNLGILLDDQQRYEEAEKAYRRSLKHDPTFYCAWYNLGILLDDQQRYKETEKAYRKALKHDPTYVKAWYNLGTLLKGQKRYAEAKEIHRTALKLDRQKKESWEKAEEQYRAALVINPSDANTLYKLAWLFGLRHRSVESCQYLKRAISLDPKYKEMAQSDFKFDSIRKTPCFQQLIGQ